MNFSACFARIRSVRAHSTLRDGVVVQVSMVNIAHQQDFSSESFYKLHYYHDSDFPIMYRAWFEEITSVYCVNRLFNTLFFQQCLL